MARADWHPFFTELQKLSVVEDVEPAVPRTQTTPEEARDQIDRIRELLRHRPYSIWSIGIALPDLNLEQIKKRLAALRRAGEVVSTGYGVRIVYASVRPVLARRVSGL